jgi:hypothetical protein
MGFVSGLSGNRVRFFLDTGYVQYAAALGIKEGTDDWLAFCDLATMSAGRIPPDIVSDEEVMKALPILFRSVRGKPLDEKDLKELIASIRRELR